MSTSWFVPLSALLAIHPLLPGPAAGQQGVPDDALAHLEFRELGPAIMGGRIADLDVVESNPAVWYVGTATGGVWRTANHGSSWTPLFDDQPCSSIGDVTLHQANPRVVWVGTGEPQNRQSSPWGCGVFRSTDGGRTWEHLGLVETRHVSRIQVHPRDPDVAWVAAVGHLWGPNPERGVYRTTDGGRTWEKVLYVDENTGAIDLAIDPGDPRTLFAAMYQRRRTGFGFSASGEGSGLFRTTDGGSTWEELTRGLPEGDKGRIGVDVYRRDGNLVYAVIEGDGPEARGVYRSTDRGESWEKLSGNNPRPMYFSMIRIDPNDPERIYMGGVSLQVSDDGGRTWWERDGAEGVHVDHHALWVDPRNSAHVVIGNDGGVASTWDRAETWHEHDNLAIGQFYEVGLDMRDPYFVCGGLQDNSSWCGPSNSLTNRGIGNRDWYDVSGGDGFYNRVDPSDWRIVYSESQGGNLSRLDVTTGEAQRIRPVARTPAGGEAREYRFNWNTPILVSAHDPRTVYIGANHLLRSRDRGVTWEEASPDLTRGIDRDTLSIFGRPLSEAHLSRNDGVSSYGNVTAISESPLDAQVLYVGTDDGSLQVTRDGGSSWSDAADAVPGLPPRTWVSRIEASHHVPGRVYAAFDGHYQDDYRPWVYVSEDFGRSWRPIVRGLPDWSVNVVREHPRTPSLLFVGNEVGAYVSVDRGASWTRLRGANLPTVPVDDIAIHPRDNDLVLATHGRSLWILEDVTPLERLSEQVLAEAAHLFPVRTATLWSRAGGWPFWGDEFYAQDPPDGAVIRYWLREDLAEAPAAVASREATRADGGGPSGGNGAHGGTSGVPPSSAVARIAIVDAAGRTVRSLEGPGTRGIHTVVWDLRLDPPYETPSEERGGFGGSARGPRVLPGSYAVRLAVGDATLEADVGVRLDPRVQVSHADLEARQAALMDLHALAGPVREAQERVRTLGDQLREVRELVRERSDAPAQLVARVDSLGDEVREVGEDLGRAGRGVRLGSALESVSAAPTSDQRWQVDRAWEEVPRALERLNRLLAEEVPALYRELDRHGIRPDPGAPVTVPRRPGS